MAFADHVEVAHLENPGNRRTPPGENTVPSRNRGNEGLLRADDIKDEKPFSARYHPTTAI